MMTDANSTPVDDTNRSAQNNARESAAHAPRLGDVFHTEYEDDSASEAVIVAVSAVEGVDPIDLETLYDRINPDALDTLMDEHAVVRDDSAIEVTFQYSGYRVSVRNDGSITLVENTE